MKSILFALLLGTTFFYSQNSVNFRDYPSGKLGKDKFIKINKKSDKDALGQLYYALNDRGEERYNKINFGSNYEVIPYGVGTGCHQGVMIDLRDGMVYGLPIECPACDYGNEEYYDFRKNSFLFINTYCDMDTNRKKTDYYVWLEKYKRFKKIKSK